MVMPLSDFIVLGQALMKYEPVHNQSSADKTHVLIEAEHRFFSKVSHALVVKTNKIPITFIGALAKEARKIIKVHDIVLLKCHIQTNPKEPVYDFPHAMDYDITLICHQFETFFNCHNKRKNQEKAQYADD